MLTTELMLAGTCQAINEFKLMQIVSSQENAGINNPIVICDHGLVEANLIPDSWLGPPAFCPPGIYETIAVRRGELLDQPMHWRRFAESCTRMRCPLDAEMIHGRLTQLIQAAGAGEGRVRLLGLTRVEKLIDGRPVTWLGSFSPGMTVPAVVPSVTASIIRDARTSGDLSYNLKKTARLVDYQKSTAASTDEVLFVNENGEICESLYSNIGIVVGSRFITPEVSAPCLPGTTMRWVLQQLEERGAYYEHAPIHADMLKQAQEVILTSTVRGIAWVRSVEGYFSAPEAPPANSICALLATQWRER